MRLGLVFLAATMVLAPAGVIHAQGVSMTVPEHVQAGSTFSIQTSGNGKGVLYIVGLGQVLRRDVELGTASTFAEGEIHNAGEYFVVLVGATGKDTSILGVTPASKVGNVSFLAKPSRLPVSLHNGISGAAYIFDAYQNLITTPTPVSFELSVASGAPQSRTVVARNGYAWTQMDSASKEGAAQFTARAGDITNTRIIQQVPGDPCGLRLKARPAGKDVALETDPLRDCSGNAVPDGTIVTFTEAYGGRQTTVDVPLKNGIAQTELPSYDGAKISAATGVVLGNEIHWGRQ